MSEATFSYSVEAAETVADLKDYLCQYVDPAKFLACCEACPNYNQVWSCPPYDFSPLSVWQNYDEIRLMARFLIPGENRDGQALVRALHQEKQRFHQELLALEAQYPGSLALSCGSCDACPVCSRKEGLPCRHPEQMRCSIESLGGDVGKTAQDYFHKPILWMEGNIAPDYLMLVGGLLLKKPH